MRAFGQRASGLRLERMHASPRWAGQGFRNVHPIAPGLRDPAVPMPSLREFLSRGGHRVPTGQLPVADPRNIWQRPPQSGMRATWLGHSSVLLEIDGWRVLTDPVWGPRASPFGWLGPRRFQPAPVTLRELPPLDAVLISHDHYDHLDYPTIRALLPTGVPFITSLGVGAHLQRWGVPAERIFELDWWESQPVPGTALVVTAAPSQHFSGRSLGAGNATLWSSLVVRGPRHAVFFSGDTGLTSEFAAIRRQLGPFDLALLEVGAFHPAWGDIHLGPDHALEALELLGNPAFLPVHWGTFNLAMHAWDQPAERLLQRAPTAAPLLMPVLGEAIEPDHVQGPAQPWWRGVDTAPVPARHAAPAAAPSVATPVQVAAAKGPDTPDVPWPLD